MSSLKNLCQPILHKKRPLDDVDDCENENEEFTKPRSSKYPPPKVRTGIQVVRDFPPNFKESLLGSNPLKETVVSRPSEKNKITSLKTKELGRNYPYFGSRPDRKVKFWDPTCSEVGDTPNSKDTIVQSQKEQARRQKIKEAMIIFDEVNKKLYEDNRLKPKGAKIAHWRVPMEASKIVKQRLKWRDVEKTVGSICGVLIGDKFKYRSQLKMIGLHCQLQNGIDYTKIEGRNVAISIVDAHRYSNERESCDVFLYSGQGGIAFLGNKKRLPEDQKLERGNLALKNSMHEKSPVRVIRKLQGVENNDEVYVYDGLYIVNDYKQTKGTEGKMAFMFQLNRVPGQPQLHKMLNAR